MPELHDLLADEASRISPSTAPAFETLVARSRRRRMTQVSAVVASALIVAALVAIPKLAAGHRTGGVAGEGINNKTPPNRQAIAESLANRLADGVRLPAGAQARPSEASTLLARSGFLPSENEFDAKRFFIVPGTVDAVLAYVQAHPVTGLMADGTDGSRSPDGETKGLRFSGFADTHDYDRPTVTVEATAIAAGVAVRVDAQVVWRPYRTAAEHAPENAASATVARTAVSDVAPRTIHLDKTAARELATLLNSLDTQASGWRGCPMINETTTVTFDVAGRPLVFADTACGLRVSSDDVVQPALVDPGVVSPKLDALFGTTGLSPPAVS